MGALFKWIPVLCKTSLLCSHTENTATASQQSSRKDKTDNAASSKTFDIRLENFDVAYGEK